MACAHTEPDSEAVERIRETAKDGEGWIGLLLAAGRHGLIPLVYWNLNRYAPSAPPAGLMNQLASQFQSNKERNQVLVAELLDIIDALESQDISVLPFKGPVLASQVYGDLAFRQFSDLDLLVPEDRIPKTVELLQGRGYEVVTPQGLTFATLSAAMPGRKDVGLYSTRRDIKIDLHWRLTGSQFPTDADSPGFWDRLQHTQLNGATVRNLPMDDLLLYLCVHGSRHGFHRLDWVVDIAELVRCGPAIDWISLYERARATQIDHMLNLGLLLADDLLQCPVPAKVHTASHRDWTARRLADHVSRRITQAPQNHNGWEELCFHIALRKGLWSKFRYAVGKATRKDMDDPGAVEGKPVIDASKKALRKVFRLPH